MTQRLSPEQKRVRGTSRPDRAPKQTAMQRLVKAPPAPKHLSERARHEWDGLALVCVQIGVLTTGDLRALELLAEVLASETELRELLAVEGMTIPAGSGGSKAHPGVKLLESARNQGLRMLESFGLTPRARLGVDVKPAMKFNPFSVNGHRDPAAEEFFSDPRPWHRK